MFTNISHALSSSCGSSDGLVVGLVDGCDAVISAWLGLVLGSMDGASVTQQVSQRAKLNPSHSAVGKWLGRNDGLGFGAFVGLEEGMVLG